MCLEFPPFYVLISSKRTGDQGLVFVAGRAVPGLGHICFSFLVGFSAAGKSKRQKLKQTGYEEMN
jgi:hypothetical protein